MYSLPLLTASCRAATDVDVLVAAAADRRAVRHPARGDDFIAEGPDRRADRTAAGINKLGPRRPRTDDAPRHPARADVLVATAADSPCHSLLRPEEQLDRRGPGPLCRPHCRRNTPMIAAPGPLRVATTQPARRPAGVRSRSVPPSIAPLVQLRHAARGDDSCVPPRTLTVVLDSPLPLGMDTISVPPLLTVVSLATPPEVDVPGRPAASDGRVSSLRPSRTPEPQSLPRPSTCPIRR